ncbi:acylamino-acid-releasing enzyme-like [Chenopodium quinoa]|uniref:acylamino-acid-releasing enzyme-like n=1 Tax=Chenopodium quinoa TaxID=63459 RepID=UPI000B7979C2|nr:acylamino-acid-releasing enzyme-like [Chenopodium quinoa]
MGSIKHRMTRYIASASSIKSGCFNLNPLKLGPLFPPFSFSHSQSSITLPRSSFKKLSIVSAMDVSVAEPSKELPVGLDSTMVEEYDSLSKLLLQFTSIPSINKAWVFKSNTGKDSKAMFSINQSNLLANKSRKSLISASIRKDGNKPINFEWSPFPLELSGVALMVPSPSGSKLLMVRNPENDSPTKLEIWGPSALEKEFHIPQSTHGSVYSDGWFEGVSWNSDETLIAYVAEEPSPPKPMFNTFGLKSESSSDKDCNSWKALGDWEEGWGETYVNKRRPTLFVLNVDSGEVRAVEGIKNSLSVGQAVWAPSPKVSQQKLIFVGWSSDSRKLGMKYCYNRPCAMYAACSPFNELAGDDADHRCNKDSGVVILTQGINSAFSPMFSPDGKFLIFLSAKASIDSGAHSATNSLHRIDWPTDGNLNLSSKIVDVVPVVMCPGDSCFPGLYCSSFLTNPWLSDGRTVILSSIWGSTQVILSVDILSGYVLRLTPHDSTSSWNLLSLDEDNIIAICSSPVEVPEIKYGLLHKESSTSASWSWQDVSGLAFKCSKEVESLLSPLQFSIMKVPVRDGSEGASKPIEAIFVSAKREKSDSCNPLIVVLHGGPHSVATTGFSKSLAFLSSIGYNLLIVNYRGSLGFGEEALQSLPGKIGCQDVGDVLTAIDYAIDLKLVDPTKITVLGGSHGGFLTTHLIGQAPEKFAAAAARNPVCNLASMVSTSDIPDWCFVESYGIEGIAHFTSAPTKEHLSVLYDKSPIAHINKVKTPTIFLIGAKDLRVPSSNGLQYAQALKERGVEVKIFVFPEDNHAIDKPQSDFESFLNIGVWFKKYCK